MIKYSILTASLLYKVNANLSQLEMSFIFQEVWYKIMIEKIKQKLI